VVSVRLRARDRDACSGRLVQQRFRGKWTLAPRRDSWVGVKVRMRKTGGGRPRLSQAECRPAPAPPSPPDRPSPGPPSGCHPSYTPCVPSDQGDLDCADIDGPVRVIGPDEYGLDSDDDGVGCES
jgi:hypothetical protein